MTEIIRILIGIFSSIYEQQRSRDFDLIFASASVSKRLNLSLKNEIVPIGALSGRLLIYIFRNMPSLRSFYMNILNLFYLKISNEILQRSKSDNDQVKT